MKTLIDEDVDGDNDGEVDEHGVTEDDIVAVQQHLRSW